MNGTLAEMVRDSLEESARLKQALMDQAEAIVSAGVRVAGTFREGNRLYACGNGGSACDAIHLVEELVARYRRERPGLPAHHLVDGPTLTCWSNDYDFEGAFLRQVAAMVRAGDVLVAISTSGDSENVVRAAAGARERGAWVLALTGQTGGRLAKLSDVCLRVPSGTTERIQEAHIAIIHLLCEIVERTLFPDAPIGS
jgi:D-sedoheptulose 7-phosphate isomerase